MKIDSTVLHRWRLARRVTLGAIVISGTMATAAFVVQGMDMGHRRCSGNQHAQETFSGIGVWIVQDGDTVVVRGVIPGSPADGKLFPGAELISVDGETPRHVRHWANELRGEEGTSVELEVEYPCSGRETVKLERGLVHVRY